MEKQQLSNEFQQRFPAGKCMSVEDFNRIYV